KRQGFLIDGRGGQRAQCADLDAVCGEDHLFAVDARAVFVLLRCPVASPQQKREQSGGDGDAGGAGVESLLHSRICSHWVAASQAARALAWSARAATASSSTVRRTRRASSRSVRLSAPFL